MYNKLFTKILDSSIWMEPSPTRIMWLTFIAAMDEDGFVQFASIPNAAHRAVLPIAEATAAISTLENPDPHSSDPDHEGRRVEKVPGGWVVLNSKKYRDLVTRVVIREQTRERVAKYREKKKRNASVTPGNENVTPSETETETETTTSTLGWAEKIRAAYPRPGNPMELLPIIQASLVGRDPQSVLEHVQACVDAMAEAPGGTSNSKFPNAKRFFEERQWEFPDTFFARAYALNGHDQKPIKPASRHSSS